MQEITISIVIPNYNHAQFLTKALTCALNQTVPAFEVIVIDDGSTDNSCELVQQLAAKHPALKLLRNDQNRGVIFTLNRGLREAQGTHILCAAADDWIEPNLIEQATLQLTEYPNAGLWSSGSWIAYEESPDQLLPARMYYPLANNGFIKPTCAQKLIQNYDSWFMGNCVVMNREYALQECGYIPELQSFCDNFLYRILAVKYGCCFNSQKLSTWRIRKQSYANAFNVDPSRQINVLQNVASLMQIKYADLFAENTTKRVTKRLYFNLARTLWLQYPKQVSSDLLQVLNTAFSNKIFKQVLISILNICALIPKLNRYLGQLVLFLAFRAFDVPQQLKLYIQNTKLTA